MTDNERIDFITENHFAKLAFLQHAQIHLMRPAGWLDGDFSAILRLQWAVGDLLEDIINHTWNSGYDSACDQFCPAYDLSLIEVKERS
jgi:hypothetical protein